MKPQRIIDTPTIKWMRKRIKPAEIESSLTSLLLEKEKRKPMLLHLIENSNQLSAYAKPNDEPSKVSPKHQLNPMLFFNQTILSKVYQIRDIFLEFDADRSRTLEISELLEMFNSNSIPITQNELMDLFTTGKRKRIEQYRLTFLDIVMFSLSLEHCKRFRAIMKKVKERTKEGSYIPLDFNRVLEFFYNKGKIKNGIQKIQKGIQNIERMDRRMRESNCTQQKQQRIIGKGNKSIFSRLGLGKGVNVNQVCKGFNDVIEASSHLIHNSIKVSPTKSNNASQDHEDSYSFAVYNKTKAKLKENHKSKLTNSSLNTDNTSLPLMTISATSALSSRRRLINYKRPIIDYIYPNISSSHRSRIANGNNYSTIN